LKGTLSPTRRRPELKTAVKIVMRPRHTPRRPRTTSLPGSTYRRPHGSPSHPASSIPARAVLRANPSCQPLGSHPLNSPPCRGSTAVDHPKAHHGTDGLPHEVLRLGVRRSSHSPAQVRAKDIHSERLAGLTGGPRPEGGDVGPGRMLRVLRGRWWRLRHRYRPLQISRARRDPDELPGQILWVRDAVTCRGLILVKTGNRNPGGTCARPPWDSSTAIRVSV